MDKFVDKLRNSMTPHPTQRSFTLAKWEIAYLASLPHSESDKAVYTVGSWVFDRLECIRQQLADLPLGNIPEKDLPKYICGALNLFAKRLAQKHVNFETQGHFMPEQLIQAKLPKTRIAEPATPDEVMTQTVDGARYPLSHALLAPSSTRKKTKCRVDLALIQTLILLGEYYDIIETIWLHSLWHGLRMDTSPAVTVFSPQDLPHDENRSVSEYRRQALQSQAIQLSVGFWKSMSVEQKREHVSSLPRVRITGSGKSRKLMIHQSGEDCDSPPVSTIMRVVWQDEYLDPLMTQGMPRLPGLTLESLLTAWETLRSLAVATLMRYPMPKEQLCKFGEMAPYATAYGQNELVSLLRQALGVSPNTARQVLSLLTFDESPRCELWSHPLVEISKGRYVLLVATLLYGNVLRCVEQWMHSGGIDLGERGPEFEQQVRKEVTNGFRESTLNGTSYVHQTSFLFKVGKQREEIDVVLAVGSCIVVAEVKCQVFPSEALDFHIHYSTLKGAAQQAKRKADFVRENLADFISGIDLQYSISASDITVIPCVISNQPFGIGFPIDGVAVTDLPILLRFIDGKWEQFVLFDECGRKSQTGKTTHFYKNANEAGGSLSQYLLDPPQIRFLRNFVKVRKLSCPALNEETPPFVTLITEVRLPVGDKEYESMPDTDESIVARFT